MLSLSSCLKIFSKSFKFFNDNFQSESFESNINKLKSHDFEIIPINFEPFYEIAQLLYEGSWVAERYNVIKDLLKKNPNAIHSVTRQIIQKAENFSAADTFVDYYKLSALKRKVKPILTSVKMLCVPSIPTFYSVNELIDDPSVFPLAIPVITGPGAIATVILIAGSKPGLVGIISTGIISTSVLFTVFVFFSAADGIERLLGKTGIDVLTRLLGMLLAALSVQFVIEGIIDFFPN